jgi:glycerol-3-phosphate acyltransferase PlsY
MSALLVVITAYLLGSIPFGYLIVKATRGRDVRESGSGGTGATNVSRSAGKLAGVLTLVLDALKGTAAVLIARLALAGETNPEWWIAAAAVAVLLGHIFPVWLQFRGGKGVATGLGVFVVMFPFEVAIALVVFLVVVLSTRYVSLASMSAAVAIPAAATARHLLVREGGSPLGPLVFASIAGAILIITAHRQNIQRLIEGKEPRFR